MTTPGKPLENAPLGKTSAPAHAYDPSLLYPLARPVLWRERGHAAMPWQGTDLWTAWELSWLAPGGVPRVAVAEFAVPCDSPCLIESKSLKLYLGSLSDTVFPDADALAATVRADLSAAAGAPVGVMVQGLGAAAQARVEPDNAVCIDAAADSADTSRLSPDCLQADPAVQRTELLVSHLLRSNCPVTGQPDWASIWIAYQGPAIAHDSLLRYLVSWRHHQGFHEQCVEGIYLDILSRCQPRQLSVYARYLRRGGLDINPWRSSETAQPPPWRAWRQ